MNVTFDKRGCARPLRRWPDLACRIPQMLASQAENGFFKCKSAAKHPFQGHSLKECRVNSKDAGSVRVAFWVEGDAAQVVYITPTLVKRDFTQELERFLASG
ncbi:hypothetical protein HGI81_07225 [Olsenella sp. KGMB02461]|nr:hypothetical protein [Olsenella sp. KGMB02461]